MCLEFNEITQDVFEVWKSGQVVAIIMEDNAGNINARYDVYSIPPRRRVILNDADRVEIADKLEELRQ